MNSRCVSLLGVFGVVSVTPLSAQGAPSAGAPVALSGRVAEVGARETFSAPRKAARTKTGHRVRPIILTGRPVLGAHGDAPRVELRPKPEWFDDEGLRVGPTRIAYRQRF